MAFRWKNYEQPNMNMGGQEAFDAGLQARNAAQMQGYNPAAQNAADQMQGYLPNSPDMPQRTVQQPGQAETMRGELESLKMQLSQVDEQIAAIDKTYPNLGKNSVEWSVAADRASIGDMSAYDNMMSRGASAGSSSELENGLYGVEKVLWSLDSKDDQERAIGENQIRSELTRAEEQAARSGKELPPVYWRVKAAFDSKVNPPKPQATDFPYRNAQEAENAITSKVKARTLTDADIDTLQKWVDANPNNAEAKAVQGIVDSNKGKTVEARDKAKKAKENANTLYGKLQNLPPEAQVQELKKRGPAVQENFKRFYTYNDTLGYVPNKR